MSKDMIKLSDASDVLNRLRTMKFQITPEERQLLGITEDDIASFTSEELSAQDIQGAVYDIIQEAYRETPAFKKLVDEDVARDPKRLARSSKVISKFLKHLRSAIPPDKTAWISGDTFSVAHDIMQDALSGDIKRPEAPVEERIEIAPLNDDEFKLFGVSRERLTPDTRWENIKDNVLFFLGKLKDTRGKTIKNDLTKKMPDDTKISYMERFLNHLRNLKITTHGRLKPFEEKDFGRDINELKMIARAIVLPPKKKEVPAKKDDIFEMQQDSVRLLNLYRSLVKLYENPQLQKSFDDMTELIDTALPTVSLVEDRLNSIQDAVNGLDLSKLQFRTLLEVDTDDLSYDDPSKSILEDYELRLRDIDKKLAKKPEDKELLLNRKNTENSINQLRELGGKDLSLLTDSIESYFETLRAYKENLKKKFSDVDIGRNRLFRTFVKSLDELVREFNRLATQQLFKARWEGRGGHLFRKERSPEEEVVEASEKEFGVRDIVKMAAIGSSSYADVLEKFRGKGIGNALEKIHDIFTDDESGLPFLEQKLLSIMEVGPGISAEERESRIKRYTEEGGLSRQDAVDKVRRETGANIYNLTGRDYTGNPLGGEGSSLSDISKVVNKLRDLIKKIKVEGKTNEAEEIIKWAADLTKHIKRMAMKKAEFAQYLRRIAHRLLEAEDAVKERGHGTEAPYREPGKAGWFVFRERMTKLGKKAMKSFFDRPNFAAQIVEAMERAGLNKMLVEGGKVDPRDIDPILEEIIKKVTGKTGNLENILGTKAMQQYRKEFDIKKINKELEEARDRLTNLNEKITDTENEYIPRLEAYAEVLKDPQTAAAKFLQSLRGGQIHRELHPEETEKKVPTAEKIDSSNYYPILNNLFKKYVTSVKTKSAAAKSDIPTVVLSKYLTEKATLSRLKKKAEKDKKPEDIRKYYHMLNDLDDKVNRLFIDDDVEAVLEADKGTLANLEAFTTGAEGLPDLAKKMLQELKSSMEKQDRAVKELKKLRSGIDSEIEEFRSLYEFALSPELKPEKDEAEKAKEEYREGEKAIAYIMDRSRYKKNMNEIMTYKPEKMKIEWPTRPDAPTLLPPERKKEYEDKIRKMEQDISAFRKRIDFAHKETLLETLRNDLKRVEEIVKSYGIEIEKIEKMVDSTPFDEILEVKETIEKLPEEHKGKLNKDEALITEKAKSTFDGIENMKKRKDQIDKSKKEELKIFTDHIIDLRKRISELEKEMKRIKPEYAPDKPIPERIKDMRFNLQQLMAKGKATALKSPTPEQQVKDFQDRLQSLQEMKSLLESEMFAKSGDPSVGTFLREVNDAIESTKIGLEELGKRVPAMVKTAQDTGKDLSEYEYQLEFGKGLEPAPYMKELKKPRGWEVLEKLFREMKREQSALKEKQEKGYVSNLAAPYVSQRLDHLEDTLKALDAYKKQLVGIRYKVEDKDKEDFVSFENLVNKFEDLVFDYMDKLKKFKNQRDDTQKRILYLRESMDHLKEMFDPDTGKFIGMDEKEIANLKGIFLRMLYKELEGYWATQIGKNLSVFGDRDTDWYNNVFSTFKNLAGARGNKKALAILNKYKQETRSDFDDIRNRLKSQQLEKEYERLMEGYQELGMDPSISTRLKDLRTRIETLKKQEKGIDRIFKIMATASQEALHEQFKDSMRQRVEEARRNAGEKAPEKEKPLKDVDFDKKIDTSMESATGELAADFGEITKAVEEADKVRSELNSMGREVKCASENKILYNKLHRDYNHRILYGSIIQAKITELMALEMRNENSVKKTSLNINTHI